MSTETRRPFLTAGRLGSSLVSVSALIWATQAFADTTIGSGQNTPVATSTAANGAPDNVVISGSGAITPTSGTAVTLDSDNTVSNSGSIQIQNVDDATGILALGGHTGSITNSGTITINETTVFTDTNGDGLVNGPFATGSRRFGVRVIGPGDLAGAGGIINAGTITVQGNDSAGISVETNLGGPISNTGTISVTGTNSIGLRTTGSVGGNVSIFGAVSAIGQGAQGVALGGDVSGGVIVQSTVTATGYRTTTRNTDPTLLAKLQPDDLLQGGPALSIAGSVAKGLLVDAPPPLDATNTDLNGNGIADASELTGSVTSYGGAPAIVVGAVGRDVNLGDVGPGVSVYDVGASAANAYGVVIHGMVSGLGVYDGVSSVGLQLGVAGGGAVTTGDGVLITGSVTSSAYSGNSTALLLNSGAVAPTIVNTGTINADVISEGLNVSHAIDIEAGANVGSLVNSGTIWGSALGQTPSSVAVIDRSGTLSSITNTGVIQATVSPSGALAGVTGTATVFDLTANTGGVQLTQSQSTTATTTPLINGAILLGSGGDQLNILAGAVTGDIAFGAGANGLTIDGGGTVTGALTAQGGTLALRMGTGVLQINNTGNLALTSLNLGSGSQLMLTADPSAGAATTLTVAGAATIADGAKIGLRLTSLVQDTASFTVIRASQLSAGAIDSSLLGSSPYLYNVSLATNAAAGTVSINVTQKTAADLQLPASVASAYQPIMAAADRDAGLRAAMLAQSDRAGFTSLYAQMLPDYSGDVFQMAVAASDAFGAPIDDRQDVQGGGAWVQELNYGMIANGHDGMPGYKAWGLGVVGGYEAAASRLGIFGVTLGASSSEIRNDQSDANQHLIENMVELGGYWRVTMGGFSANARLAGDYLQATSNRVVATSDTSLAQYSGTAQGRWSAGGETGRLHASYEAHLGDVYLRPQVAADYFRLSEGGYSESGGGALDLQVDGRTSSRMSAFAGVAVGALFTEGADNSWGPELLLGYRDVVSQNLAATTGRFIAGGNAFTLAADNVAGGGATARISIKGENGSGGFSVEGGAEARDSLTIYDLRLAAHFQF
ncbi:autotransporter domain-containing protein [Phenylobacterium hankyongense]|uniref:Autotransporter domain-containing protein n=1 Tax=Phenylobacterium hankyongense TaxID=1813876 RepID=A0A328ATP0_9CAUL|nr:autotransporter outer membrane beta-barrel domain-containing protein [Phenylobacterium hankyongense]RAK58502.1 autotransporter domain-containing protein [Phenylobacterium hankyongense]